MAVLAKMTAVGMDQATYDKVSPELVALVKKQPGFLMHIAYPSPTGFTVHEIWESRGQYENWFNENVKPNVPAEIRQEVTELYAVVRP